MLPNAGQFQTFNYHFQPPSTIVYYPRKGKNKGKTQHSRYTKYNHSTKPYLTLIRSSFSSIDSAAMRMKITVAAAWIKSIGKPDT